MNRQPTRKRSRHHDLGGHRRFRRLLRGNRRHRIWLVAALPRLGWLRHRRTLAEGAGGGAFGRRVRHERLAPARSARGGVRLGAGRSLDRRGPRRRRLVQLAIRRGASAALERSPRQRPHPAAAFRPPGGWSRGCAHGRRRRHHAGLFRALHGRRIRRRRETLRQRFGLGLRRGALARRGRHHALHGGGRLSGRELDGFLPSALDVGGAGRGAGLPVAGFGHRGVLRRRLCGGGGVQPRWPRLRVGLGFGLLWAAARLGALHGHRVCHRGAPGAAHRHGLDGDLRHRRDSGGGVGRPASGSGRSRTSGPGNGVHRGEPAHAASARCRRRGGGDSRGGDEHGGFAAAGGGDDVGR